MTHIRVKEVYLNFEEQKFFFYIFTKEKYIQFKKSTIKNSDLKNN